MKKNMNDALIIDLSEKSMTENHLPLKKEDLNTALKDLIKRLRNNQHLPQIDWTVDSALKK